MTNSCGEDDDDEVVYKIECRDCNKFYVAQKRNKNTGLFNIATHSENKNVEINHPKTREINDSHKFPQIQNVKFIKSLSKSHKINVW